MTVSDCMLIIKASIQTMCRETSLNCTDYSECVNCPLQYIEDTCNDFIRSEEE